jgi:hypothetical protein
VVEKRAVQAGAKDDCAKLDFNLNFEWRQIFSASNSKPG